MAMIKRASVLLFVTAVSFHVQAGLLSLGDAAQFNAYILGDMTGGKSDVEGRLAVGGSLNVTNFAFGKVREDGTNAPSVIVGQDATLHNVGIFHGDFEHGGNLTLVKNKDELGNDMPSVDFKSFADGKETVEEDKWGFEQSSTFDFESLNQWLIDKSNEWGQLAATAVTKIDDWSNILFRSSASFNVFSISALDFSKPSKSITYDLPVNSVNIVNVMGSAALDDTVDLFKTGFHVQSLKEIDEVGKHPDNSDLERHDGRFTNNIIYNFVDIEKISLSGIGFKGSILAPLADTMFTNGHIDGQLIVKSLSAEMEEMLGQINEYRFNQGIVSAPSAWMLLVLAFCVVWWGRLSSTVVGLTKP